MVSPKRLKVAGVCFSNEMKVYVLWTLKLMKDVPTIFEEVQYFDMTHKHSSHYLKKLREFNIVIVDSEESFDLSETCDTAIIACLRGTVIC